MIESTDTAARQKALRHWLTAQSPIAWEWMAMPFDCSFRRYYRVRDPHTGNTAVIMDAPPQEDTAAFVQVGRALEAQGLWVPHIYAVDIDAGFAWLSDLGTQSYPSVLTAENATPLYQDALRAMVKIYQTPLTLPVFDASAIARELENFKIWFLQRYARIAITPGIDQLLSAVQKQLIDNAEIQPQVCLHRDYHAGNLQYDPVRNPGILDFQGAMRGPITYDVVSLLRDSRIVWPESMVDMWLNHSYTLLIAAGLLPPSVSFAQYMTWCDLMGLQLHLKIFFIFARKHCRDHHSDYLRYLPNLLGYVQSAVSRHPHFRALGTLVEDAMGGI